MDRLGAYDMVKARQASVAVRADRAAKYADGVTAWRRARTRGIRVAFAILAARPVRPFCCAA
jgi:hypothetical protein